VSDEHFNEREAAMPPAPIDEGQARLPRVTVDLKIPLWGLASAAVIVVWGLVSMYFKLTNVSESVISMQADVRAFNAATTQFASEQALIKYRVEKLEMDRRAPPPSPDRR
jgi:hypothetical protein